MSVYVCVESYPANDKILYRISLNTARELKKTDSDNDTVKTRLEESLIRTKRKLFECAACNDFTHFCTFTFADNRYDYQECKRKLTKFFNNYKNRKSSDFIYCVVPEQHKDGAFHFHGFVGGVADFTVPDTIKKRMPDGSYADVPNTPGYLSWPSYNLGWFNASPLRDHYATAKYVSKYITKEIIEQSDAFPVGCQLLLHSQGLTVPDVHYKNMISSGSVDMLNEYAPAPVVNRPGCVIFDELDSDTALKMIDILKLHSEAERELSIKISTGIC